MITPVDRLFEPHLTVSDLDASIAFYRDRVGPVLAHVLAARQAAFLWIGSPGTTMLGLWAGGSAPRKTTTHVAFVAGRHAVVAAPRALQSAGITPLDFDGRPTDEAVVLAWMPAVALNGPARHGLTSNRCSSRSSDAHRSVIQAIATPSLRILTRSRCQSNKSWRAASSSQSGGHRRGLCRCHPTA